MENSETNIPKRSLKFFFCTTSLILNCWFNILELLHVSNVALNFPYTEI